MANRVDVEVADPVPLRFDRCGGPAAHDGPHPGGQLPGRERLGDVVVGAEVEAEEHVVLGGAGGEHDDRHVGLAPHDAGHVEAVHARHHPVEDHEVGLPGADLLQRAAPVVGHEHRVALALEVQADQLRLLRVVLGDENPAVHASPCRSALQSACYLRRSGEERPPGPGRGSVRVGGWTRTESLNRLRCACRARLRPAWPPGRPAGGWVPVGPPCGAPPARRGPGCHRSGGSRWHLGTPAGRHRSRDRHRARSAVKA